MLIGKVADSIPDKVIGFLNWYHPSRLITSLGYTRPVTELSIKKIPEDKGRPARKAGNLTDICEPIV
jgi:hypothetical protein